MKKASQLKNGLKDDATKDTKSSQSVAKFVLVKEDVPTEVAKRLSVHRCSFMHQLQADLDRVINMRKMCRVTEMMNGQLVDLTPKDLTVKYDSDGLELIKEKSKITKSDSAFADMGFRSQHSSITKSKASRSAIGFRMSMDDVTTGIGSENLELTLRELKKSIELGESRSTKPLVRKQSSFISLSSDEEDEEVNIIKPVMQTMYTKPFIRITLHKTELILLFETRSLTAIKNTEDASAVEIDNKQYDYLTVGRGKVRRKSDNDAQTASVLYKSRTTNTAKLTKLDVATYVSNYEMYDTVQAILAHSSEQQDNKARKDEKSFDLTSMVLSRMVAGNNHGKAQKRFRNMNPLPRTTKQLEYKYSLSLLFSTVPYATDGERKAVSDISFCYGDGDIFAAAYGIYSYHAARLPTNGQVCIWNIKNPEDPERYYTYQHPVVALEFSPYITSLLAIGLFDGTIEVRDIAQDSSAPPIAVSQRSFLLGVDPVLSIKWIKQLTSDDDESQKDPFISLSQDGSVTLFRIINSPYLQATKQIIIERIEGIPEGLKCVPKTTIPNYSSRRVQGLNLTKHPVQSDIYYVLTDEGCLHKCSVNHQGRCLHALKTHDSSVNCMDFSPWSPKIFLTCGNDWCIRIWIEDIFQPLLTLRNQCCPYQWANWSRTHSTVIIALTRSDVEIWDININTLKPKSITELGKSYNTMARFSLNGTCLCIGNGRGNLFVSALEEFPFASLFQYDQLEKAIYKAVANRTELLIELKSLGYFGYPHKGCVVPP